MHIRTFWRSRSLRWGVFLGLLGGIAAGLHAVVPAEPRWVLEAGALGVFDIANGQIAAYPRLEGKETGPLQVFDAATGQEVARFLHDGEPFRAHSHSDDGRSFVAIIADPKPGIWRIHGVDLADRSAWQSEVRVPSFASAVFAPRCNFVALMRTPADAAEAVHRIVETRTGRTVAELPADADELVFGADGGCAVASYRDAEGKQRMCVVDTATGTMTVVADAGFVAVAPDSCWLIGDRGDAGVWLWDRAAARWHVQLTEKTRRRFAHMVVADLDGTIELNWVVTKGIRYLSHRGGRAYSRRAFRASANSAWVDLGIDSFVVDPMSLATDRHAFAPNGQHLLWASYPEESKMEWALHDSHTGKPLWKRQWQHELTQRLFTPDSRRLVILVPAERHAEIIDVASGVVDRTIPFGDLEVVSAQRTRDGRTLLLTGMPPDEEPHWLLAKIEDWLVPPSDAAPAMARAYDIETGTLLSELPTEEDDARWLTDDRRTLVSVRTRNGEQGPLATTIRAWDMPPRQPLRWVLGVPVSLGLVLVSLRIGWSRLRRRARQNGKPGA